MNTIILKAAELIKEDRANQAVDLIYMTVEPLLWTKGYDELDEMLSDATEEEAYSLELAIDILTATLPVKGHLESRPVLLEKAKSDPDSVTNKSLLTGLI